jgi:hypothetical protein
MGIRMIAKELYRLEQAVEELEKQESSAPPDERDGFREQLRQLKAERNRMRKMLEGEKVDPPYRQTR